MGYQERHWEIVDCQRYPLEGTRLYFRGPAAVLDSPQGYFSCIGAAQTFGCFCTRPFPTLLDRALGLPVLNLGYASADPYFYLKNPPPMKYVRGARFVVIHAMSGRSESNSLFDSGGVELLTRRSEGRPVGAGAAYRELPETRSRDEVPAHRGRDPRQPGGQLHPPAGEHTGAQGPALVRGAGTRLPGAAQESSLPVWRLFPTGEPGDGGAPAPPL
jgi:hypothetical protein